MNKTIAEMLRRRAAQTAKSLRWNSASLMLACLGLACTIVAALNSEHVAFAAIVAILGLVIVWSHNVWQAKKLERESFDEEMRILAGMLSGDSQDDNSATTAPTSENQSRPVLSHREIQVLREAALGKSNKEISLALSISHQTVKNHMRHIFEKLNVTDRTAAVLVATGNGWLDTETASSPTASR